MTKKKNNKKKKKTKTKTKRFKPALELDSIAFILPYMVQFYANYLTVTFHH